MKQELETVFLLISVTSVTVGGWVGGSGNRHVTKLCVSNSAGGQLGVGMDGSCKQELVCSITCIFSNDQNQGRDDHLYLYEWPGPRHRMRTPEQHHVNFPNPCKVTPDPLFYAGASMGRIKIRHSGRKGPLSSRHADTQAIRAPRLNQGPPPPLLQHFHRAVT